MRIISGKNKGKKIFAPTTLPARPTTDFAKESLFNILNNYFYLEEISVLDLFAGTGNISYEFASRGCPNITAIDAHPACVRFIQKTAKELGYPIRCFKADVFSFLEKNTTSFDVIFADPPYDFPTEKLQQIEFQVFEKQLLPEQGFLIIEHSSKTDLSELAHFSFSKKYGGSTFSFFAHHEEA